MLRYVAAESDIIVPMVPDRSARPIRHRDGIPIAPGAFPLVGHAPRLYRDAIDYYRESRDALGPLFWSCFGLGTWVLVCTAPESLELLGSRACGMSHVKQSAPVLIGDGLLGQDGIAHQRMRAALNVPFSPRGLATTRIGVAIADIMARHVERWAASGRVTVLAETQALTLEVIFRLIGIEGQDLAAWGRQYRDFALAMFPVLPSWIPGSPMWRAVRARRWLDDKLLAIVRAEQSRENSGGFLSEMAHGKDERGEPLAHSELVDNLRLLTIAGHETTAALLAWITIVLAQNPDLWTQLCDEANALDALPTTPQEIRACPFAEALFRETLRAYPISPFTGRTVYQPVTLCGHALPQGVVVYVALPLLLRDPALFPDPERFDVSRWLSRAEPPSPLEVSQFGGGGHFCLGYHLAWLEAVQFALTLARHLSRRKLQPRLVGEQTPRHYFLPAGHPAKGTQIEFV